MPTVSKFTCRGFGNRRRSNRFAVQRSRRSPSEIARKSTLKTIGHLDHCSSSLNFGISRGFSKEFVNRGGPRFFRPLLYRMSYLGGSVTEASAQSTRTISVEACPAARHMP